METNHSYFPVKEHSKRQFSEKELTQIFHHSVLKNARASGKKDKYGGMVVSFEYLPYCVPVYRNFVSAQYM